MSRSELAAVWPPTAAAAAIAGHSPMSPMQAIRRKCLDCSGSQKLEVRLCEAIHCPLWPFRAGRHPYTRNRVQEAISAAHAAAGTGEAEDASPSQNGLLHATFAESGASSADEEG
jgi:hypothetical protein